MSSKPVVPVALLAHIDALEGTDFEDVVGQLFRRLGYDVRKTEHFDYGADLIATNEQESIAIQVKRYGQRVSEKAVRDAHAGKAYYGCDRAMVVSNHRFMPRAVRLAKTIDVELWDRMKLVRQIQWFCADCGIRLSSAERRWCFIKHEEHGGNVYCLEHQPAARERVAARRVA
jgi:HJR/Mrr/RecB family endonuclease